MKATKEFLSELPDFTANEFMCKCGCGMNIVQKNSVIRLQTARIIAGIRFKINSASRCAVHNIKVGGSRDSSHLTGHAFDISATDDRSRSIILNALRQVGFTRIGIRKTFIHADDDETKDPDVTWLYI